MTAQAVISIGKLAETLGRIGFAEEVEFSVRGAFGGIYRVDLRPLGSTRKEVYNICAIDHKWWTRTW